MSINSVNGQNKPVWHKDDKYEKEEEKKAKREERLGLTEDNKESKKELEKANLGNIIPEQKDLKTALGGSTEKTAQIASSNNILAAKNNSQENSSSISLSKNYDEYVHSEEKAYDNTYSMKWQEGKPSIQFNRPSEETSSKKVNEENGNKVDDDNSKIKEKKTGEEKEEKKAEEKKEEKYVTTINADPVCDEKHHHTRSCYEINSVVTRKATEGESAS